MFVVDTPAPPPTTCGKRSVYELYARAHTYEELHERNRSSRHLWDKYIPNTSFKFTVNGYNHSISKTRQRQVIEDFAYMELMGRIDLVSPEVTMGCFEECAFSRDGRGLKLIPMRPDRDVCDLREVFFGRLVRRGCRSRL